MQLKSTYLDGSFQKRIQSFGRRLNPKWRAGDKVACVMALHTSKEASNAEESPCQFIDARPNGRNKGLSCHVIDRINIHGRYRTALHSTDKQGPTPAAGAALHERDI